MKKTLMILTIGLFFGTISFTSTAMAKDIQQTETSDCNDKEGCKKENCCKKKAEATTTEEGTTEETTTTTTEAKACTPKEGQKACCSKSKKED